MAMPRIGGGTTVTEQLKVPGVVGKLGWAAAAETSGPLNLKLTFSILLAVVFWACALDATRQDRVPSSVRTN